MRGRALILAGGGGHTGYAFALAQALQGEVSLSFLVPEGDTLSEKRLSRLGEVGFLVKPRGPETPTHQFAVRLAESFAKSVGRVPREVDVVVSTGSNFCVPPALVAWAKGIPVVNIESSVRFSGASATARLLQHFSVITALHWEEQRRFLDGVVVGPLLPKPEFEPRDEGYILVTGGTYGHRLLFDAVAESELRNVVLQTGRVDPAPYAERHPEWRVITLIERFHELLAGAEVVVTHFGSTALDAVAYRKPLVLVPNPELGMRPAAVEDAGPFARKVNAVLVSRMTSKSLLEAIDDARGREPPELPDGTANLAERILDLISYSDPRSTPSRPPRREEGGR